MLEIFDFVENNSDSESEDLEPIIYQELELELNDITITDLNSLFTVNKKILIIGNKETGKSTFIENIGIRTNIITDTNHLNNFYSKNIYDPLNIYTNYGMSLKSRLLKNNGCLIVDNYIISDFYIKDLNKNLKEKNMLFLLISTTFIYEIDFDYIFICKLTDKEEIQKIYNFINFKFNIIEEFIYLINECTQEYGDTLIIDCKCDNIKEIFKVYTNN